MSDSHKQAISDAMKAYWATIPYRPTENNESNNQRNDEKNMQTENSDWCTNYVLRSWESILLWTATTA